jgi:hypothetical protein
MGDYLLLGDVFKNQLEDKDFSFEFSQSGDNLMFNYTVNGNQISIPVESDSLGTVVKT